MAARIWLCWLPCGLAKIGWPLGWPTSLEFLSKGSDAEFFEFVNPLADMTELSYTATWGTYYKPSAQNQSVEGWRRMWPEANPVEGGMRALTFVQERSGRGVVVFRGTDLDSSGTSGQADACANAELAHAPLPGYCNQFTSFQLDYVSRALDIARKAAEVHPTVEWLYTGHSLGAELANVVGAVRGAAVLGFAAPAVLPVLRDRTAVDPHQLPFWKSLSLYNELDPLRFQALGQLPGANCSWVNQPDVPSCDVCELHGKIDEGSPECKQCFYKTHILKSYLALLRSGQRPVCPDAELGDYLVV
ncbi:rplX [Symbiodinium pilosum]|uniref:RplX protein n=1 Tax=Symbiodinium pilosum TaxID=2952 RepID=A0A812W1T4_SYMPI|nr:rplX [Symbiodinium pilosum]